MFIVGFVIFSAYMYLMIWNIFYSARKQREENYPDLMEKKKRPIFDIEDFQ